MAKRKKQKKQYVVEEGIFSIYSDFPVFVNDKVLLDAGEKPLHFHYYLEIGYCMDGKAVFTSNKEHELGVRDISITAPNILHNARSAEENEDAKLAYIYMDFDELVKMFPAGEVKTQLVFVKEILNDILFVNGDAHPEIVWMIDEVIRVYNEKQQSYKMQVVGLLYIFLLKVYDLYSMEIKEGDESRDFQIRDREESQDLPIKPAIEYIYEKYMEPIKVAELARECHFSESYFRKVFLEMKGMTPMEYLNSIRIRAACKMLQNTTGSVRMIGEKCGYPSVTTFERNFKQRTGMLPSQWRESQKNPRRKDRNTHEIKRMYHPE